MKYIGTWRNGRPSGHGACEFQNVENPRKFKNAWGTWRNGVLSGACRIELVDGGSYHGCIDVNGDKSGAGKYTFPYVENAHSWEVESESEASDGENESDSDLSGFNFDSEDDESGAEELGEDDDKYLWGMKAREDASRSKEKDVVDDYNEHNDGGIQRRVWDLHDSYSLAEKFPFSTESTEKRREKQNDANSVVTSMKITRWSTYEGTFQNDVYHGHGMLRLADGLSYKGQFDGGKFAGSGFLRYPDSGEYSGMFQKGMRWGDGNMKYKNGDWYDGEWRRGKPHGQGSFFVAVDKQKFVGEFVKGSALGV